MQYRSFKERDDDKEFQKKVNYASSRRALS